jgi:hypothetical protein
VKRAASGVALAALAAFAIGCHGATACTPQVLARGELTLRYDDRFELWAANQPVAYGTRYAGLQRFVACVPAAAAEARAARSSGNQGLAFTGLGVGFGTLTLGGLGGLAFQDRPAVMGAFFAGAAVSASLGIVFGALARRAKNDANGHAIDAMNYYNDAVGSQGGSCFDRR